MMMRVRLLTVALVLSAGLRLPVAGAGGLSVPLPGPTTTQQAVDRITRSATRPLPSVAAPTVVGPDTIWVPEHFTLAVEQHVIDAPGVGSHGINLPAVFARGEGEPVLDLGPEAERIPAH